jgi:uncharacterized membrane protein YbhN (UPF0104 family)
VLESVLLVLLPHVPPAELLASVLLYRVIFEILPLIVSLVLWGGYELANATRGQRRVAGADNPTIDSRE